MAEVDWDKVSGKYNRIVSEDPIYPVSLKTIVEQVVAAHDESVLDLGCGTGNLIHLLLEKCPDSRIIGVDPSAGMREVTADRFSDHPNVSIEAGDAIDIPFPDNNFDYVVSNLALHHVVPDSRERCARELARVVKTGGHLVYSDYFCGVEGPPEDPERCRDIIERITAKALLDLEHGAYEMMLAELEVIPKAIRKEEDYLTTVEVWIGALEKAGFSGFEVIDIPPIDLAKIICCELTA
jgi:ubiquinone/menaquinone biosynthesis C-methylase UbiE